MTGNQNNLSILSTKPLGDYELLDSGNGEKLERFGTVLVRRPDPQALWQKQLDISAWNNADATFHATWSYKADKPKDWRIVIDGKSFELGFGSFKHVGVFPEQRENWNWIEGVIASKKQEHGNKPFKVLNLFGYTGGATLASLKAGAEVTHVDGSKSAIATAKANVVDSGLRTARVRYMLDDVLAFVLREARRGNTYDGITMDPPSFGRGAKGEVWNIETSLPKLLAELPKILTSDPSFVLLNGYASGYSALAYYNCLGDITSQYGGKIESGELAIEESSEGQRLLPAGIFARWHR